METDSEVKGPAAVLWKEGKKRENKRKREKGGKGKNPCAQRALVWLILTRFLSLDKSTTMHTHTHTHKRCVCDIRRSEEKEREREREREKRKGSRGGHEGSRDSKAALALSRSFSFYSLFVFH